VLVLWDRSVGHGNTLVNAHVGVHMLPGGNMVHPTVSVDTMASARCLDDPRSNFRDTKLNFIRLDS
jgi:hypothetical protein